MTTPDLSRRGKWGALTVALLLFGIILAAGFIYFYDKQKDESPKVLTTEQTKDTDVVAKEVHVSQPAAQTIVREIERTSGEAPAITYYVQSPTVEKAAEKVAKQIETRAPEAPAGVLEKSDRTIVTPNTDKQKVDVYRISLRKAHKVKAGVTYVDSHAYLTTGYQAGKWEGLIHFDTRTLETKGGTITYTVFEW
jgi:hypothetical protein